MRGPFRLWILLCLALCAGLSSCGSLPSKRLQELLVKQGFGKRAEGDAQVENYATTGAQIRFIVPPILLENPALRDLMTLAAQPQVVGVDGTIYVPGYGSVYVLGLTEKRIAALVTELLQASFAPEIVVEARILSAPKFFYMFGETVPGARPFVGDLTMLEVFATNPILPLANIGKIRLVRADPRDPFVVTINMRDIVLYGISTYNLNIKENDIIYVPPTFFGSVSRFLEKLIAPVTTLLGAAFTATNLRYQYRVLRGDEDFLFFGGPWLY